MCMPWAAGRFPRSPSWGSPNTGRDVEILEKILQGGLAKMQEADCTVIGGHSIGDEEIKFGYAVTGVINPQRVLKNVNYRAVGL